MDMFAAMPKALARECRRATRLIGDLCQLDRARSAFRVESTERAAELVLAGARVAMRIDRVDVLSAGGRAVLDYIRNSWGNRGATVRAEQVRHLRE